MTEFLCRSCLASPDVVYPFQTKYQKEETDTITIEAMLRALNVATTGKMPTQLCASCLEELFIAHYFQQKCKNAEIQLNKMTECDVEAVNENSIIEQDLSSPEIGSVFDGNDDLVEGATFESFIEEDSYVAVEDSSIKDTASTNEETSSSNEVREIVDKPIPESFECNVCHVILTNDLGLRNHSKCCHPESDDLEKAVVSCKSAVDREWVCPKCGSTFSSGKSLNIHIKHNRCPTEGYPCTICQRVFVLKGALVRHMLAHDGLSKKTKATISTDGVEIAIALNCIDCSAQFGNAEDLANHMQAHRDKANKHTCKECGKGFAMLSTLKDHSRMHSGEKPFLCAICGRGFTHNTNLKQHMMRHRNIKPFKCEICPASFVSKCELKSHLRKHSGEHPFVCDTCGTGFTTSSSLVKHRRIHTGERPYACEFCTMRFSTLGTLKNHRRIHTGEKPYICQYCSRAFTQRCDMIKHTRTHTGERPYCCETCGQGFLQSSALKNHQKLHSKDRVEIN